MDRKEIWNEMEKILAIVDDQLLERVQVREETAIREGLGLDSLQLTEVLFEIEERLGVKIADEEARELRTAGDLVSLVEKKLAQAGGKPAE